jgi:pimeloyl-ACP methyl ester carboxylesterase
MPHVPSRSASIYYEVHGEGPALVFAHGAAGNSASWWQQVPHFAARYRVVTFDHRSFGRSTCPPKDFHVRHFADDLIAVLDAEEIDRAALVCQSLGGWTGVRMAIEQPERLSCLMLCGTPGGISSDAVNAAMARVGSSAAKDGITSNRALGPDFQRNQPELTFLYDQIARLNENFSPALLANIGGPDAAIDPASLADHSIPTLVVASEHDALFPPEAIREVASLIPGAELREIAGSGHSPYFEVPAVFNRIVDDFVARHSA